MSVKSFFYAILCLVAILAMPLHAQETPVIIEHELLEVQPYDRPLGNEDAPVTMVEYASLSCSHCAKVHNEVMPELIEKYVDTGKVRLLVRNFPTNAPALHGSMLTMCVNEEQFHPFLKVLYKTQSKWAMSLDYMESLKTLARVGGVSETTFDECMANEELEKQALEIRRTAAEALSIEATPTSFINGERLQGSASKETFFDLIDKHLAGQ